MWIERADVDESYEQMLIQLDGEFSSYSVGFSDLEEGALMVLVNGRVRPGAIKQPQNQRRKFVEAQAREQRSTSVLSIFELGVELVILL